MLASVSGGCEGFPAQPLISPSAPFMPMAPPSRPRLSAPRRAPLVGAPGGGHLSAPREGALPCGGQYPTINCTNMPSIVDAVADPVRARLLRRLWADGPGSLEELARGAGVHPNTARVHLAAMEDSGLVQRE